MPVLLTVGAPHSRLQDDTDGETGVEHWLTVTRVDADTMALGLGEQTLAFRATGPGAQVARALAVVAEAIRRDELERPRGGPPMPARSSCPDPATQQALDLVLEAAYFIPTLAASQAYRGWGDGIPANPDRKELTVYIAPDSDVHLWSGGRPLRFRDYFGGGLSLRTRQALLVLAEALRRTEVAASADETGKLNPT